MASGSQPGQSAPLGDTVVDGGVNFSLFSRNATGVELVFFAGL
jgi:isoamylase